MPDLHDEDEYELESSEHGELTLKIADPDGREWIVSTPYPEDEDLIAGLDRLRQALTVLHSGGNP